MTRRRKVPTTSRRRSSGDQDRRLVALLAVGAALAVCGAVLWGVLARGGSDDGAGTSAGSAGDADPGVVHVHGLGINPRDNTLFAATHTGLFRLPAGGKAERVAGRFQDTMGFTVAGPDHFLGSGHPDLQEMRAKKLPPLLGLIESRDAGRTWQARSLLGEADFHALHAVHGRIYGFDSTSGDFMVSADGTTWERRGRIPLLDFAVSPADPELTVATTQSGPQRSRDGGRAWERLNAPALAVLAWEQADHLYGIASTGAVYESPDHGTSWEQRGAIAGQPAAFVATGGVLYAAAHDGSIYQSADNGRSWQLRFRDAAAR